MRRTTKKITDDNEFPVGINLYKKGEDNRG